jgi:hypothetical protein
MVQLLEDSALVVEPEVSGSRAGRPGGDPAAFPVRSPVFGGHDRQQGLWEVHLDSADSYPRQTDASVVDPDTALGWPKDMRRLWQIDGRRRAPRPCQHSP